MNRLFEVVTKNPKTILTAVLLAAALGVHTWKNLAVDIFPDISIPRITIQTEAGGLSAEEVEQLVTIPIESVMNGIKGVSTIRSSSSAGLSFVWIDFDWNTDISRARFDVFERLARVEETLPEQAHAQIAPIVSVTGEIMLVALTAKNNKISPLEIRELAEYDLRTRLLAIAGIGEVALIGGRLPEFRIAADPKLLAQYQLSLADIIEAAQSTRTFLSAGYLADVRSEEIPIRQIARADTLDALKNSPIPLADASALRIGDVAEVSVAGEPRRGSASFNGQEAIVLSVQKTPGGNTLELTKALEHEISEFAETVNSKGIEVHCDAYRQADFIDSSIKGGGEVLRDAVIIVIAVLLLTLLELRTIIVVLLTMPISILAGLALFPLLGLGVNVMTIGGFAVAAGDIVDASIIFTEVIRRKLGENAALSPEQKRPVITVISEAAASVAPSVMFSTMIVVLVFIPFLMLSGLEGRFFRPLAASYICVFTMSLLAACTVTPALSTMLKLGDKRKALKEKKDAGISSGIKIMRALYRPFLVFALRFPMCVVAVAVIACICAIYIASGFGSSFLPPLREDSFNVMISLPPGASLSETERISEAAVPAIKSIQGVLSVTRRTGRAERDQHAEPVSSSEFVVRVDLNGDTDRIREQIRERLGKIPGCALIVGYPIAHRISAVLSGTEAELAVNIFGEDIDKLRQTVAKMKAELESIELVADVRANREIMVRTLRIDYDMNALTEAGITPREAGEQVAAAFNGARVGEVRHAIRKRSVTVRLAGDENKYDIDTVKSLLISSRRGKRVRLDEIAEIKTEDASNLLLREGCRRKAMISCNPAADVSQGKLVEELRSRLLPIAKQAGCTVSFDGSYQARVSAGRRIGIIGIFLTVAIFFILTFALGSGRAALLSMINVPLGLIGSVIAVSLAEPVLSVSSLVGFVTVVGFVLRNGILLINCYREKLKAGFSLEDAIRCGSEERMAPIIMTSLTTVIGLIPIMLASSKPGGELLAPLAIVQFGGLLGATVLNLVILPAATKIFGLENKKTSILKSGSRLIALALLLSAFTFGCRSYSSKPVDWNEELQAGKTNEIHISTLEDASTLALIGNCDLNAMRLKAANSAKVAKETGWWEDPEIDFDIMRIVNPSDNPFLGGGSIAFTVPLSGALKLDEKAARAYAAADAADIRSAECDVAAEARKLAIRLDALQQRAKILQAWNHDPRIEQARKNIVKLHEAGEITSSQLAGVKRRVHALHHDIMENEKESAATTIAFLRLSGLRPGTAIHIKLGNAKEVTPPECKVEALELAKHPKVIAALTRLGGSEQKLHAEIRRQYPDLKLGPAYVNEEGLDRFGIVAGLTVPLWNRNRKNIAEAEADRDALHLAAINIWRTLVCDAAEARANLLRLLKHPPLPNNELEHADILSAAGELTPLEYIEVREEILNFELAHADWRREVALSSAELEKYNVK